jgi:hypothetical protein
MTTPDVRVHEPLGTTTVSPGAAASIAAWTAADEQFDAVRVVAAPALDTASVTPLRSARTRLSVFTEWRLL